MTDDCCKRQEHRPSEELLIPLSITRLTSEQKVALAKLRIQAGSYLDPEVFDIALDEMVEVALKKAS